MLGQGNGARNIGTLCFRAHAHVGRGDETVDLPPIFTTAHVNKPLNQDPAVSKILCIKPRTRDQIF